MKSVKYWYLDNWTGLKREFNSLPSAKKAAKKETGMCIYIYNMKGHLALIQEASGFTPS